MANTTDSNNELHAGLGLGKAMGFAALGVVAFHLSYAVPALAFLLPVYLAGMAAMSLARTRRKAFYPMLLVGLALYAPHLAFFWTIFGPPALMLWLVLAFWLALFSVIAWFVRNRLGVRAWLLALPVLWTGLEYFRSELYYLRFSWLNSGYALSESPQAHLLLWPGMFGIGFVLMAVVAFTISRQGKARWITALAATGMLALLIHLPAGRWGSTTGTTLKVAGIQAEFPNEPDVPRLLDKALAKHPDAELFVLSEYTFDKPVPQPVRDWCRAQGRHLIVGGKEPASDDFYNTAFVVDPTGEIVFKQVKSVPIQFFADGLPAAEQNVWQSPWGKLAIPTCYDLSYTRVIDRMIARGAQAIINPTMDMADWGAYQHALHGRVPRVRAAEHDVPVFRVASSGISQVVNARGLAEATAPFPGDEAVIGGELRLAGPGRLPLDRWLAPACALATGLLLVGAFVPGLRRKGDSK